MNTTTTSTTEFLDLRDGRLAYDTGGGILVLRNEFQPTGVYLDFATYGLPPKVALGALSAVTAAYTVSGTLSRLSCLYGVQVNPDQGVMMRVVVAGATGAIGQQLVPRLVAAGHEVWTSPASSDTSALASKA